MRGEPTTVAVVLTPLPPDLTFGKTREREREREFGFAGACTCFSARVFDRAEEQTGRKEWPFYFACLSLPREKKNKNKSRVNAEHVQINIAPKNVSVCSARSVLSEGRGDKMEEGEAKF